MKRIFTLIILLGMIMVFTTGCPFIISSEHTRSHVKAMNYNVNEIHHFIDRHFWLYEWEDPYVN